MDKLTQRGGLSIPDAAEYLGISTSHAWNMARSGELPTIRLRKRVIVPTWALLQILRQPHEDGKEAA